MYTESVSSESPGASPFPTAWSQILIPFQLLESMAGQDGPQAGPNTLFTILWGQMVSPAFAGWTSDALQWRYAGKPILCMES